MSRILVFILFSIPVLCINPGLAEKHAIGFFVPQQAQESRMARDLRASLEYSSKYLKYSFEILEVQEEAEGLSSAAKLEEWLENGKNVQVIFSLLAPSEQKQVLAIAERTRIMLVSFTECDAQLRKNLHVLCPLPDLRDQIFLALDTLRAELDKKGTVKVLALQQDGLASQTEQQAIQSYARKYGWKLTLRKLQEELSEEKWQEEGAHWEKENAEVLIVQAEKKKLVQKIFHLAQENTLQPKASALLGPWLIKDIKELPHALSPLVLLPQPVRYPDFVDTFTRETKASASLASTVALELLRYLFEANVMIASKEPKDIRRAMSKLVLPKLAIQDFQIDGQGKIRFPQESQVFRREEIDR